MDKGWEGKAILSKFKPGQKVEVLQDTQGQNIFASLILTLAIKVTQQVSILFKYPGFSIPKKGKKRMRLDLL